MGLFGLSLPKKKQIQGLVAQANPFDGGKTYNTVVNNRQPVANSGSAFRRTASKAFDQVNPIDSGRTWKQRTPTFQGTSGFQQGLNRFAGTNKFTSSFNERLHGGNLRGVIRTGEWIVPGDQKWMANRAIDKFAPEAGSAAARNSLAQDADKNSFGGKLGTGAKFVSDTGAIIAPTGAVDKFMKGTKAVQYLSKGGAVAKGAGYVARVTPGSIVGSGVDAIQEIGRGNQVNPVKSGAIGLGIDLALPVVGKGLGKAAKKVPLSKAVDATSDIANKAVNKTVSGSFADEAAKAKAGLAKLDKITKEQAKLDRRTKAAANAYKNGNLPNSSEADFLKAVSKPLAEKESTLSKIMNDETGGGNFWGKSKPAVSPKGQPQTLPKVALKSDLVDSSAKSSIPTTADRTDQVVRIAGVDPEAGLVQGNFAYNNPVVKNFNKLEQGYRNLVDKGRDAATNTLEAGMGSTNPVTSRISRTPRGVFNNFGRSEAARGAIIKRTSAIEASSKAAQIALKNIEDTVQALPDPAAHYKRVYQVLESKDFLKKVYGDSTKLSVKDLTPQERVAFDKLVELNKIRNDLNLETGQITKEMHDAFADGMHSPRVYDMSALKQNPEYSSGLIDSRASVKRKDIMEIDDAITANTVESPYLASLGRLELALRNKANLETLQDLNKVGQIVDKAPNNNYAQLVGNKYGEFQGKYVDKQLLSQLEGKDFFNTKIGQATGNFTNAYANSPIGKADKAIKVAKTAGAPAVGAGNVFSNIFAFSGAANINPATASARMAQAGKQLYSHSKKFDPNVFRAEKAGLFSGDTGKQLLGITDTKLAIGAKKSKNPVKAIVSLYSNTDKAAALGLFNELKARGLSDADAVRRVHSAVQNYGNSGRMINTLADSPVLGKPFARFTPELLRIAKNNVIYNPAGTAAKVGGLAAGLTALSARYGETADERKAREEAVGQTQLPLTSGINKALGGPDRNVSLNVPVGDTSVNVARLTGLNFPIEPNGNSNTAIIRQMSPFADPTRTTADGQEVIAPNQLVSSLTLRPIVDQIANRDFMGRQISDPQNKVRSELGKGKSEYENADGSRQSPGKDKETRNRLTALASGYVPGFNEVNSIVSAARDEEDFYGKERTLTQGILRAVGLKAESNDKKAREKRVSTKDFYEGEDKQVKEFLRANPDKADDYFKLNDSSRDRFTNKKSSGIVKPEKWAIIKAQTDDKLFNQLKQEAITESKDKKNPRPLDPIYSITNPQRVKQIIDIRARVPGDEVETEEILRATTDWYPAFEKAERDYNTANSAWFKKLPKSDNPAGPNDRAQSYLDVGYAEQPALVKKYYQLKESNPDAAKELFKTTDLSGAFDAYAADRLRVINEKRKILGVPPIDQDTFNNVTFGYEDDEKKVYDQLKYGKGYGSYGGGGGRRGGGGGGSKISAAKYLDAISAPKVGAKPSTSVRAPVKLAVKAKTASRPTVSIKKSSV